MDHFDILPVSSNKLKELLMESLLVKGDKPILNRAWKVLPLELFDWDDSIISSMTWLSGLFWYIVVVLIKTAVELGYVLICQVKEKRNVVLKMLL